MCLVLIRGSFLFCKTKDLYIYICVSIYIYTYQPRLLAAFIGCLKLPFLGLTLEDVPASYWVKVNSFSWASCFVSTVSTSGGGVTWNAKSWSWMVQMIFPCFRHTIPETKSKSLLEIGRAPKGKSSSNH